MQQIWKFTQLTCIAGYLVYSITKYVRYMRPASLYFMEAPILENVLLILVRKYAFALVWENITFFCRRLTKMIGRSDLEEEFKHSNFMNETKLKVKGCGKVIDDFYEWTTDIKRRRLYLSSQPSTRACDVIGGDTRNLWKLHLPIQNWPRIFSVAARISFIKVWHFYQN